MRHVLLTSAAAICAVLAGSASAQTTQDVIVMRRTVTVGAITSHPGQWRVGDPVVTPGCSATQPTQAPVTCIGSDGKAASDSFCAGTAKPTGRGTTPDYSTCTYAWAPGEYGNYAPTCSANAYRTRSTSCLRSDAAHTPVDASKCDPNAPGAKTSDGPLLVTSGCTYAVTDWNLGTPSTTCGDNTTRTDTARTCSRSGGDVPATATIQNCTDAGIPTTRTMTGLTIETSCTFTPTWSAYGACQAKSQTSTMTACRRSGDNKSVELSKCGATTRTQACSSVTCDPLVANKAVDKGGTLRGIGKFATAEAAAAACTAEATPGNGCYAMFRPGQSVGQQYDTYLTLGTYGAVLVDDGPYSSFSSYGSLCHS